MAMRMSGIKMTTKVDRLKLLATLEANLATHSKIVQEARDGYIALAKDVLSKRLEEARQGKVVSLSFNLAPPQDYSEVYRNSIEMLRWNTAEVVELEADEFRQLVRDEWDWSDGFLHSNKTYSATAHHFANQKGL